MGFGHFDWIKHGPVWSLLELEAQQDVLSVTLRHEYVDHLTSYRLYSPDSLANGSPPDLVH